MSDHRDPARDDKVDNHAVSVLNELIETCKNGEEGFRTAADGITDQSIRIAFAKIARDRWGMARELQEEVEGLGGSPQTSGSVGGTVHRGWMNIKSLVTGRDDQK